MEKRKEMLEGDLRTGKITAAVYGLGHVGIPLAIAWLMAGARVIGVDPIKAKVDAVNSGTSPVDEPGASDAINLYVREGRLSATASGSKASEDSDVKLIVVPVELKKDGKTPEMKYLKSAAEAIAAGLKRGDLVILETSVPPGTTRGFLGPLLEKASGLRADEDFGLAYSPERISEGRAIRDIVEAYPKIIGGVGQRSAKVAATLYRMVCRKGVIVLSSDLAAELEKLLEGIYRDVNIALANEVAGLCRSLGIDFEEARMAANSQPYSHVHRPGPGVGGYCLPIYPGLLMRAANEVGADLPLVKLARTINDRMPGRVKDLIREALDKIGVDLKGANIALLGIAFRADVPDSRKSPTYSLVQELRGVGVTKIKAHDPFVREDQKLAQFGVFLEHELEEAVRGADAVVLLTDHSAYRDLSVSELSRMAEKNIAVIDGRDIIDHRNMPGGSVYVGVGRPWSP